VISLLLISICIVIIISTSLLLLLYFFLITLFLIKSKALLTKVNAILYIDNLYTKSIKL
jgi:hypothetical protein